MPKVLALVGCWFALVTIGYAQSVTSELVVSPTHGPSDVRFTATYRLKGTSCPAGKPVDFTWQSSRNRTLLGTSDLEQVDRSCTATFSALPPLYDRNPAAYTVCGTYLTPEQQTIAACADYRVDPGGPSSSPSPSPTVTAPETGGPGGTSNPGSGGSNGTLGTGPGGSVGPGGTSSPGGSVSPGGSPPEPRSGLRSAILIIGSVGALVVIGAIYGRSVLKR
jgi:hypothetical protein